MSTHMDPGFLVKLNWPDTGLGALAERVKVCCFFGGHLVSLFLTRFIVSCALYYFTSQERSYHSRATVEIWSNREVYKRNIELVNENAVVEFRAQSLKFLIEKDRDIIASQEVLISEYKDKLAESEARRRILVAKLRNTTSCTQIRREDARILSGDLYDTGTQIKFFESGLALEVSTRDSIATLDTVTGELETTGATLGLEISQLEAQLANIQKRQSYQQSRTVNRVESATLENRITLLVNDFESKNRNREASNDEVLALQMQLAEQSEELGAAHDVIDDLEDFLDIKNGYIQEIQVQHDDEVAKLNAYILALEKELEASKAVFPTTATALDFDDAETPIQCNLPNPNSHPEKPTPESSDVGDGPKEPENPELSVTQEYFRVYSRRRGGEPIMFSPPHLRRRWRVKDGRTLGCYSCPSPMNFGITNSISVQPGAARSETTPSTSWKSARLSATAVAFVPRSDKSARPSRQPAESFRLRPTATSFQPSCNATRAPNVSSRLNPTAPTFVPRGVPILDAPRLQATAPVFVRQSAATSTNTSLRPIATAFVPRHMSDPQLRGDTSPFVPRRGLSAAPLQALKTA